MIVIPYKDKTLITAMVIITVFLTLTVWGGGF